MGGSVRSNYWIRLAEGAGLSGRRRGLEALGEAFGEAVEDHRHQREGDRHLETLADLVALERLDDQIAEPTAADEPGDETIATTIRITWSTASMIAGRAAGSARPRHLRAMPRNVVAASIVDSGTGDTERADPTPRDRVEDGGDDAARQIPTAKIITNGIAYTSDGSSAARRGTVTARPRPGDGDRADAERQRDRGCDHHGDQHLTAVDGRLPQPDESDAEHAAPQNSASPPAPPTAEGGRADHERRPGDGADQPAPRTQSRGR